MTCLDVVAILAMVAILASYFYRLIDRENGEDDS